MSETHNGSLDRLLDDLIEREGGYVDHPDDRGGPTNYGITAATARRYGYDGGVQGLPLEMAREIYRARYWTGPALDRVADVAPGVAAELFDTGVNMGPATAIRMLQRALNAMNRNEQDWSDLVMDGQVGPATLSALTAYLEKRVPRGEMILLRALDALQGARYIELAEARPANESFVYGWLSKRLGNGEGDVL
ncbi:hypothetical protein B5C34_11690 [Pacificimonas flava]|uniref:Uncharacterized protein n=2 Tax=Pacificimonas TaxID=1960290 RepID=A0A219B6R3_9SPHN|nr:MULTISPECIES: glycosyl hydrolase 108 family protein [Pacificimonas]MBZ6378675.1 hypothetical protein [Pacificimonas aurantium]OWV34055.1 hypothetical protein B5C34_11690 [Pacificimonas flava]